MQNVRAEYRLKIFSLRKINFRTRHGWRVIFFHPHCMCEIFFW